jgi:hypothetical protein
MWLFFKVVFIIVAASEVYAYAVAHIYAQMVPVKGRFEGRGRSLDARSVGFSPSARQMVASNISFVLHPIAVQQTRNGKLLEPGLYRKIPTTDVDACHDLPQTEFVFDGKRMCGMFVPTTDARTDCQMHDWTWTRDYYDREVIRTRWVAGTAIVLVEYWITCDGRIETFHRDLRSKGGLLGMLLAYVPSPADGRVDFWENSSMYVARTNFASQLDHWFGEY